MDLLRLRYCESELRRLHKYFLEGYIDESTRASKTRRGTVRYVAKETWKKPRAGSDHPELLPLLKGLEASIGCLDVGGSGRGASIGGGTARRGRPAAATTNPEPMRQHSGGRIEPSLSEARESRQSRPVIASTAATRRRWSSRAAWPGSKQRRPQAGAALARTTRQQQ